MSSEQLAALIDKIYDCATMKEGFADFAKAFAEAVRAKSCIAVLQCLEDFHPEGTWIHGADEASAKIYFDSLYKYDLTVKEHFERARETAYASRYTCHSPEFETNPFFKNLCTPLGVGYFAGIYTPFEGTLVLRLTVQGAFDRGQFDADDLALMDAVMPHLRRGVEIHRRFLEVLNKNNLVETALQGANAAFVLLNHDHDVVFTNEAADKLLGTGLARQGNKLKVFDQRARVSFGDAVRQCFEALSGSAGKGEGGYHVAIPRDDMHELSCYVAPLRLSGGKLFQPFQGDLVAIQLFDPKSGSRLEPELLSNVLGLTTSESRVAAGLCDGKDVAQIAETLGISPNTVREYLRNVYLKLDVSKQSECVARVYSVLTPHLRRAQLELEA